MKVYLKGVSNIGIRDDGYLDVHLDMVYEKGSVGYDEMGFWIDATVPYGVDLITGVNTRVLAEKARQARYETE